MEKQNGGKNEWTVMAMQLCADMSGSPEQFLEIDGNALQE